MEQGRTQLERFVRVTGVRAGRWVEFEFSVNDGDLMVELILPFSAFEEFCATQEAVRLPPRDEVADELEKLAWRARQPGLLRRPRAAGETQAARD